MSLTWIILALAASAAALPSGPLPTPTNTRLLQRSVITSSTVSAIPTGDFITTKFITIPGVTDSHVTVPAKTIALALPTCVQTIEPDANGYVPPGSCGALWNYYPSFAAAIAFAVVFGVLTAVHIWQAARYKKRWCWVIIMASIWETLAFVFRSLSTRYQQSSGIYLIFQIFILLAPLWVNAFAYMTLGRMIHFFHPSRSLLRVPATFFAALFVALDVVSFIIQLVGGSMAGPTAPPEEQMRAIHIYMGGIGLQEVFILAFVGLALVFQRDMRRAEKLHNGRQGWRPLVWALYFSLGSITVRIIYRLIEFSSGNGVDNQLITREGYFYALEGVPMVLAIAVFNVVHPGAGMNGPGAEMPGIFATIKKAFKKRTGRVPLKDLGEEQELARRSPTALRRRRRRRVPDADRKRAPRACDRCKARKNKCVETPSGTCVRCLQGSHPCRFERERSPEDAVVPVPGNDAHTNTVAAHNETTTDLKDDVDFSPTAGAPPSEAFMWPRFLTRLRSAFCLDTHPAPASPDDTSQPQARPPPPPAESQSPAELRRVRKAVRDFPPRGVAEFLLEVCITYGTDLFFYFDQAQLTAELGAFYSDEGCRLRSDTGFVCFVLAVFALGSHWTSLARPAEEDERAVGKEEDPGRIFYDQARILMADLIDRPCLRSVQAAYVLGVYLMPASAISASYVYMGLALRKALAIGLHLEPDEPGLSEDEKEMRRRLWWSVYSLERTVTIKLNRPRSISQDIITARLPRPVPRDAEQKFDNVQHQIVYAQLVRIIDKLSEPAAWSTNSPTNPVSTYEEALKSWKRSLPPPLKLQNIHPKSPGYRAVFHLHLNYYFAWIDVGKVSVVTVVRARLRALFCPADPPPAPSAAVEQAADACIRAAKKMLELFEGLSRSGNMARFSFTDLQGCSIATIVVLLAGILQRDAG
ncbi:putative transcriptional regulatory protein, partial [Colletotrichum sp. SAR 10_96]